MKKYKANNSNNNVIEIIWKYNNIINEEWIKCGDLYGIGTLTCLYFPIYSFSSSEYVIKNGSIKIRHEKIYHKI